MVRPLCDSQKHGITTKAYQVHGDGECIPNNNPFQQNPYNSVTLHFRLAHEAYTDEFNNCST
jgi:hypothetical protein